MTLTDMYFRPKWLVFISTPIAFTYSLHYCTGIIAGSAWGAMHGFKGVSDNNFRDVEFGDLLKELSVKLYEKAKF